MVEGCNGGRVWWRKSVMVEGCDGGKVLQY